MPLWLELCFVLLFMVLGVGFITCLLAISYLLLVVLREFLIQLHGSFVYFFSGLSTSFLLVYTLFTLCFAQLLRCFWYLLSLYLYILITLL